MSKINPILIIKDHLITLVDYQKNQTENKPQYSIWDFFVFYGIPLIVAIVCIRYFKEISSSLTNILITTFSIFVGLLLNLLVIIYDLVKKSIEKNNELKRRFLREIFSNVSYSILISLLLVCCLLISLIDIDYLQLTLSFVSYFLIGNFFLTILMILKRIHILLSKEFDIEP